MRRWLGWGFVGAVVLLVTAGAVARVTRGSTPSAEAPERENRGSPTGYWVWSAIEAPDGRTAIAPEDLEARVGPTGWPGCPEHYVCTRHGVRSLAIGPTGAFHYTANVFTSSDFQHHGRLRGNRVELEARWSCAHPGWRSGRREPRPFLWARDGDTLRVAVDPSVRGGGWPFAGEATGTWWVFRRITRRAYYDRVLLRLCQPTRDHACAPGCFSERLVTGGPTP